ncbi:MAG: dihydropteroate synthase [Gammaproteobacteria bacterium]|nr:dihydropteroate synthase [Gammaproteobacteria bacterium]
MVRRTTASGPGRPRKKCGATPPRPSWLARRSSMPLIMGILNATPDSFSGDGLFADDAIFEGRGPYLDGVVARAATLVAEGADLLDVGGESTRPGAVPVSDDVELARVIPVIAALAARFDVPISVDTSSPVVMREAATAGAALINDVRALRRPGAMEAAAATRLPVCLMHMQGDPGTMQAYPHYGDVVAEVRDFLAGRVAACGAAGMAPELLLVDPGFGFGKTLAHNLALLRALSDIAPPGVPVVAGLSRKRMVGEITGRPVASRIHGSVALALLAARQGAAVVRVHDVAATADALKILAAVEHGSIAPGPFDESIQ